MKTKKIYAADDEATSRELVRQILAADGYKVETFESGDDLFARFKKTPSDLVLLDVMMPGSTGYKICQKIRKISPVPIIILSARDSDLDYATAMEIGGDDYFRKPFSKLELSTKVKAIFRRVELDKEKDNTK